MQQNQHATLDNNGLQTNNNHTGNHWSSFTTEATTL